MNPISSSNLSFRFPDVPGATGSVPVAKPAPQNIAPNATDSSINGVFWIGANGHVYTNGNGAGVTDRGYYSNMDQNSLNSFKQIDDPNPPSTNFSANAGGSGGGGVVYPDLSGAIEILRQNIAALDPLYNTDVANAGASYDTANNERMTTFGKTKLLSDTNSISNDSNILQSSNAINKNARMSSEDILAMLGSLGMSGSTTDKALSAIADTSNSNMNSANYDYGKNKQSILQSWNDYVIQDANQQKQLADKKSYDIAQAGITRANSKKTALGNIASNQVAMGKGVSGDILGEMAAANNDINSLSKVNNTYTGVTPTYAAPAISTILGQNMTKFDVAPSGPNVAKTPKLIKVNEQTGTGDQYGIKS